MMRSDSTVEVAIADNGIAIDEADLTKIFDPFFTTKERGTGLGLSVVYGIVRGVGGDLRVTSRKGEGTTVRMRFPVLRTEAPGAGVPSGEPPRASFPRERAQ